MSKEKKRKVVEDKNKEGLVYFEIWGILLILLAIILLSELGPVGQTLNLLVKMVFGDWYWLILVFMFYYGTMMIIYHEFVTFTSIKLKGIFFISAGLLIYSHFPIYQALKGLIEEKNSNIISESYNLYLGYIDGQKINGTYGGGILGAGFFWGCFLLLGDIGTKIIAIVLLISGVAYLFEKTVYDFIDDLYYGSIKLYKNSKKWIKRVIDKMKDVSVTSKNSKPKIVVESVETNTNTSTKFDSINVTKNERYEYQKKKYVKPNLKSLKYHDNQQVLELQKEITIENAKIINAFLKSFYLNLEINEIYMGPTISSYIIEVENSLKSKKILNYKDDLITRLDTNPIRIVEKYEKKHIILIEVPNKYRYLVSLRELLEEDTSKDLLPIGRDHCGKIYHIDFKKMANTLVMGHDINSKIDLLKTIVNTVIYKFTPEEFKLVLCDSTKFELNMFEECLHLYHNYISEFHSMKPMLIKLYTEVEKRLNSLNNHENHFVPILLILNDFVDFYNNNLEFLKYLSYVLVYGGKVGIYTLYATTNLDEKVLNNNLRAQFNGIISFMINSKEISFKFLEDDVTKLLKEGDCLIFNRSDHTNTRVQLVNVTSDDILL